MNTQGLLTTFRELYNVCNQFASRAEPGADIRNFGLTPDLLERCRQALESAVHHPNIQGQMAELRQEALPADLREDGWELYVTTNATWYAYHPPFQHRTAEYPIPEEAIAEARALSRPY